MDRRFPNLIGYHIYVIAMSQWSLQFRVVLTAGVLAGVFFIWGLFIYIPLNASINKAYCEIQNLKNELLIGDQKDQQRIILQKKILHNYGIWKNKYLLSNCTDDADEILKLAQKMHLRCVHVKPINQFHSVLYDKYLYEVTLRGAFQSIVMFLKELTTKQHYFVIEHCDLTKEKQKVAMKMEFCILRRQL